MKAIRQIIVCCVILVAGLYVLATQVPAAGPILERYGLLEIMGLEPTEVGATNASSGRPNAGAAKVLTAIVKEQNRSDRITAIGDARARYSVTVRSNAVGVITELSLTAGSFVKEGTVIARLQDEAEQIALEKAQIQLEDARLEERRFKSLETTGAVTAVRLRETEVALRTAELAVRQAEFDLSLRQVTAPISGWVGIIGIQQGDRVNAQDVLATITDRSDILIDFRVPERIVTKLRLGQEIDVTPLGLRSVTMTGEIGAIDSVVDRASRTLLVQGRVMNSEDLLRAGMAFSVSISFPGEVLLAVPPLAVQWSSEGPFVWAIRDDKATQVAVVIVQRSSDTVLVSSEGLQADEVIVTEGVQTLREGAAVDVMGSAESATLETKAETL